MPTTRRTVKDILQEEKITARKFSFQVIVALACRVSMVSASMVTGLVLARVMGAGPLGTYAVLTLAANTLTYLIGSGLASSNVFFAAKKPPDRGAIVLNSLVYSLVVGGLAASALVAASAMRPSMFHDADAVLVVLAAATIPLQSWNLLNLNSITGLGRIGASNVLEAIAQIVPLFAVVATLLFGGSLADLLGVSLTSITALSLLIFALTFFWTLGPHSGSAINPKLFCEMMNFGLRVNVMNAAMALILRADVLLVNYFRGPADAGVYSVASQCALFFMMFPNVVGAVLMPNLARSENDRGISHLVLRHVLPIEVALAAAAIPCAYLLPYIYGPAFRPATTQFLIILPGAVLIGLQMILSQHLVGTGKFRGLPVSWAVVLIISIAADLLVIPIWGPYGAAFVSSASYGLIFLLTLFLFRSETRFGLRELFILDKPDIQRLLSRFIA